MRLIDADALIEFIDVGHLRPPAEICFSELDVKNLVDKQPTIEPKTGEWIPIRKGERGYSAGDFRCSVCHQPNKCYIVTNYCSHCGALMKEDK